MSTVQQLFTSTEAGPLVVGFDVTPPAYAALRFGVRMAATYGLRIKLIVGRYNRGVTRVARAEPDGVEAALGKVAERLSAEVNFSNSVEWAIAPGRLEEELRLAADR